MTFSVKPHFGAGLLQSRRTFLGAAFLGTAGLALGAEPPPTHYGKQADAEEALKGMVKAAQTDKLDPHKNDLPVKWPENTVVYPSNVQERVSVMTEYGPAALTIEMTKKLADGKTPSLYDAFYELKDGVVAKSFGSYFPLAPVLPPREAAMKGWVKDQNGKKERYVLMISGEGNCPDVIRGMLKKWADKNPHAAHVSDEKFAEMLLDQEDTNLILGYRRKFLEEDTFHQSLKLMQKTLAEGFGVPNTADNVVIKENPDDGKAPNITDKTRMVLLFAPSAQQVEEVLKKWLAPLQKGNAELLVYYNGHGEVAIPNTKTRSQGADEGQLILRGKDAYTDEAVTETQWKKWFGTHLSKFGHVAFVLDCCHSGAMFAKAQPLWPRRSFLQNPFRPA